MSTYFVTAIVRGRVHIERYIPGERDKSTNGIENPI